jgi:hypothetical protein
MTTKTENSKSSKQSAPSSSEGITEEDLNRAINRVYAGVNYDEDIEIKISSHWDNEAVLKISYKMHYFNLKKLDKIFELLKKEIEIQFYNWSLDTIEGDLYLKIQGGQ